MKRFILFILISLLLTMQAAAGNVKKEGIVKKDLKFSNQKDKKVVIVDNLLGDIDVVGYGGDEVQLVARKLIEARNDNKIQEAEEEVYLDIRNDDNIIDIYVDGPFRRYDGSINWRGFRREGYQVRYDFELRVPHECEIELQTINDGEISVKDVHGDYEIENINGGIEATGLRGSGKIYALNEDVKIVFDRNPGGDCYFGSLNGDVRIYFHSPLSADFHLKTFNGEIYSDFEVDYIPVAKNVEVKKDKGRNVFKTGRTMAVRAGKGGPQIELDGFNGDMFILEQ